MSSSVEHNNFVGLTVSKYNNDNIYPILPLLSEEFPNWTIDKIKKYVKLVVDKKEDLAGMLVSKNEALYFVGLLIYTFQSVSTKYFHTNGKDEFTSVLVIENIVASSPILKQQVFLTMVESAIYIAKKYKCNFIELPKFDENFKLINNKYKNQIIKMNDFRTAIAL